MPGNGRQFPLDLRSTKSVRDWVRGRLAGLALRQEAREARRAKHRSYARKPKPPKPETLELFDQERAS